MNRSYLKFGTNIESIFRAAVIIAGITGVYFAIRHRWVSDDSFISFRYAKNLIDGKGLVFNAGERVEGYTNFLWTVLIAPGIFFKLDPVILSEFLGILFFAGQILLLYKIGKTLAADSSRYFPAAVISWSLHHHAQVFATGGLETSMFIFLILTGTFYLIRTITSDDQSIPFLFFALSAMTRPDGAIFYAVGAAASFRYGSFFHEYDMKKRIIYIIKTHRYFILIFLPYWLWRAAYYGWPFPNTFYAKSGGGAYWSQGIRYLELYLSGYYILAFAGVASVAIFLVQYFRRDAVLQNHPKNRVIIFFIISGVLYAAYYIRVGGDFMFARFLLPVTPFLYLLLESSFNSIVDRRISLLLNAALVIGTVLYNDPYRVLRVPVINGISDENRIYRKETVKSVIETLNSLSADIRNNEFRIAIGGSEAIFAYYLDPVYALETSTGLTDEELAHRTLTERGAMVGHEKKADLAFLYRKNIHLHFYGMDVAGRADYNTFYIPGFAGEGRIVTYDAKKMESIRKNPGIRFIKFEDYLDEMIASGKSDACKRFPEFRRYYFDHNSDIVRESKFKKRCGI